MGLDINVLDLLPPREEMDGDLAQLMTFCCRECGTSTFVISCN